MSEQRYKRLANFLSYNNRDSRIGHRISSQMNGVYYWASYDGDYYFTHGDLGSAVVFSVCTKDNSEGWRNKIDKMTSEAEWDIIHK